MLRQVRPHALGLALTGALLVALPGAASAAAPAPAPAPAEILGGDQLAGYGIRVNLGPEASPLPPISAKSWVLADLTTGEILAAKGAHRQGRPASTLKTLTALTLMPVLDKDAEHTVTWKEASADGGRVGIVPDATYTNWDLFHGLLLPSGNDAAAALAGSHGGMKKTVADMQAVAYSLQADDTVVRNPSGLDADGQLTSAYDLALIARAAMQLEDFRTVTAAVSYDFPGRPAGKGKKRPTYKIYTQNRLLLHGFDGAVGGKTGYTSLAGRTFWGAAERDGHVLAVTLLQVRDRTETAAKSLLSWGFANRTQVTPVGTLVGPRPEGGEEATPTPSGAVPAPGETTVAGGAAGAPVAAGSSASPWLVALVAAVALGAAIAWWLTRRRRRDAGGGAVPDLSSPVPPRRVAPEVREPAAVEPAVDLPEPEPEPEPAPARSTPAPAAPASGGHVRVVRPPARPTPPPE
ncbi:D-alanyl-D-alanine carboxypeptidase family protein [Longivirga aurantiaca]|uniref:D-alanyl-D-alanine carboxypeptidase family protein n=1 Tax=Longivirga aurantiaca TaxID=1837743 RepID=A0ABW1SXN7_9ACTN